MSALVNRRAAVSRELSATAGRRRRRAAVAAALAAPLAAASALLGAPAASASSGSVTLGVIAPFTGSQAELGKFIEAPCLAGVRVLNSAGGIMGQKVSCDPIDDTGDAADAVPNVSKALATTSLSGVLGIDSNVAATVVPIVEHAKISMISTNGLSLYIKNNNPYFWRMTAPDVAGGAGMGLWAAQKGFKKVAIVLQNDIGDLGNKPGMIPALKKKGVKVLSDVTIPGDASSYESVVNSIRTKKPQAIILSADTQTSATFLSEYRGLNNGNVPPTIAPTDVLAPDFYSAVKKVMGASYLVNKVTFVGTYVDTSSPEFKAYYAAIKATPGVQAPEQVVATGAVASLYDGTMVLALAMTAAHSTSNYNAYIPKVTTKRAGAVEVHSYAQGVKALKSGKQIYYVGVGGPIQFDKYHNSPGEFAAFSFTKSGGVNTLAVIPPKQITGVLR